MDCRLTQLGELQVSVLQILWRLGQGTVHEVRAALPQDSKPAYTTVLTVLRSLERRQLVGHSTQVGDRQHRYHPLVSQEEVRNAALRDLLSRHFGGDADQLVAELIAQGRISPDTVRQIREMVDGVYPS